MLKERATEVLMVPPSRAENGCLVDLNVLRRGGLDLVKKAAAFNNQLQGKPRVEDFDREGDGEGVTTGGDTEKENEGKPEVNISSSDDGFLAPSSPAVAAFLPPVHEGVGCVSREMKNSTEEDFGSSPAPAQNGFFPPNGVAGLVAKENGFVDCSEKRMRNGESFSSSPPLPPSVGNLSKGKESFSMGEGEFQDCPEAPLRKRVHIEERENGPVDDLGSRLVQDDESGKANGHVEFETGKSVTGVETPTRVDEGRTSDSDERKGGGLPARVPPTPARTEGNSEVLVETKEEEEGRRLVDVDVDGEGDVEMVPEEEALLVEMVPGEEEGRLVEPLLETGNDLAFDVVVDVPLVPGVTDMDVDFPSSSENIEVGDGVDVVDREYSPRAAEELGDELRQAPWETNTDAPFFGDVFEEVRRGRSGSSRDHHHLGHLGSHPPSPGEVERKQQGTVQRELPQARRVVEVIEFDDSDDEEAALEVNNGVHESDGSSTKGKMPISQHGEQRRQRNGYRLSSSESTPPSENGEDDSDSDDCQVVGSWRPPVYQQNREGVAHPVVVEDDDEENYTSSDQDTDSSDVEEVGGSQSDIRRRWEEAAMRRRMGRAMQSAGSKANGGQGATINLGDDRTESQGLEESVATSTYRDSPDSKDQTETSEARGGPDGVVQRAHVPQGTTSRGDDEEQAVGRSPSDDAVANGVNEIVEMNLNESPPDSPGADQGYMYRSNSVRVEIPGVAESDRGETRSTDVRSEGRKDASDGNADLNGEERSQSKDVVQEGLPNGTSENPDVDAVGNEAQTSTAHEDVIAAREKLKLTPEYMKTDEAEWASREKEIQRQAVESKRLRQRKRQEADRKREMERKQKERIEELRLSQMKEERNMDLRDQLRGQVRTELERVAATCRDFATLLRQLGIQVEGGSHPSTQQVNAAYKKALFKFHPDRAVASSQGEPRYQVEAEEKFKLIQRLKDTLVPVANDYNAYSSYRSFF